MGENGILGSKFSSISFLSSWHENFPFSLFTSLDHLSIFLISLPFSAYVTCVTQGSLVPERDSISATTFSDHCSLPPPLYLPVHTHLFWRLSLLCGWPLVSQSIWTLGCSEPLPLAIYPLPPHFSVGPFSVLPFFLSLPLASGNVPQGMAQSVFLSRLFPSLSLTCFPEWAFWDLWSMCQWLIHVCGGSQSGHTGPVTVIAHTASCPRWPPQEDHILGDTEHLRVLYFQVFCLTVRHVTYV